MTARTPTPKRSIKPMLPCAPIYATFTILKLTISWGTLILPCLQAANPTHADTISIGFAGKWRRLLGRVDSYDFCCASPPLAAYATGYRLLHLTTPVYASTVAFR